MQDNEILLLFQQRDETAISSMYHAYGKYGYAIAINILGSTEDAEECVNDALLRTWNSIPPQTPRVLLAFWGKIVRNLALNRYKNMHAQKRNSGQIALALHELEECISPFVFEQSSQEPDITDSINTFLANQTKENRIIFMKRYWWINSVSEIANDLQISESKVKSSLHRTRRKLKIHLLKDGIYL